MSRVIHHRRPYSRATQGQEVWICPSSWDEGELATKFAWRTSAGTVARGGEQPLWAVVDEVAMATETGELTWDDVLGGVFSGCSPETALTRAATILGALSRQLARTRGPGGVSA